MGPEEFASRAKSGARPENLPPYIYTLFSYKNPLVRRAIWELKYRGNKKIASLLSRLLYKEMIGITGKIKLLSGNEKIILIPIPSSERRFKEKGFNQTYLLGENIEKIDARKIFSVDTSILKKTRETKTQVSIRNRNERLKNLEGAFSLTPGKQISERTIFLIDDVTTTGATFSEARNVLLQVGAKKVLAFTIAH